jgi:pyruvate dehydrogenase E2 component (dihydrolipoamide acetyltransferase)
MRRELLVPKLGLTMTEGVLVEWMVAPGASFKANQSLFVIESEKAAIEIPAEGDGVLLEVTADPGVTLPVGSVIGFWDDGVAGQSPAVAAKGPAITRVESTGIQTPTMTSVGGVIAPAQPEATRVPVTPLARRLAQQRGIDLSQIHGSGPRGRIRARDLPETASPAAQVSHISVPDAQANGRTSGTGILCQPSATEKTIARRLTAAKRDIPHFYLAVEAEVSRLQALRAELNAAQTSVRFTLNHFIVAAVGRSLVEMPRINRVWTDEGILSLNASDVGMAVSTERGLTVPVLRNVGGSSLAGIASVASCAIERAQAGRLAADDMAGGAITVSNAGMHDVTYMTSIINPGQAMILGVGSVRELFRPDAAGQPSLRREIGLVLSADHRVLDGVSALAFLKRIVGYLEQPLALLVSV